MKTYLIFMATIAAAGSLPLSAQERTLGLCETLNSAVNHQAVVIHTPMGVTRHGTFLFEGTGQDPCPGWPKRFFTAPSAIPVIIGYYPGIRVSDDLYRDNFDFVQRLRTLEKANPSFRHMVTIRGVLVRKPWLLSFRGRDGSYGGWGEGVNGGAAAVLVVTAPIEDH